MALRQLSDMQILRWLVRSGSDWGKRLYLGVPARKSQAPRRVLGGGRGGLTQLKIPFFPYYSGRQIV